MAFWPIGQLRIEFWLGCSGRRKRLNPRGLRLDLAAANGDVVLLLPSVLELPPFLSYSQWP